MDNAELADLVEASDSDGLIRFIDRVCAARDWDGLVETRDRCSAAEMRGKQLFGVVHFAEYRLALEAPGELAASVLRDGAGRFALGPLWEVAASTHEWAELDPYLNSSRMRALVGCERAVRGENLDGIGLDGEILGVPFSLQEWEPSYQLATYRSDNADFPAPGEPPLQDAELPPGIEPLEDLESEDALYSLVRPWVEESNGIAEAISVNGSALEAIAAIAEPPVRIAQLPFPEALGLMAWSAASGGAHGSRRGTSVGRSIAWSVVATLADLETARATDVRAAGEALDWWLWRPAGTGSGWQLHLAVEDRQAGYAWALGAIDKREDLLGAADH